MILNDNCDNCPHDKGVCEQLNGCIVENDKNFGKEHAVEEIIVEIYQQGRLDAIDEFAEYYINVGCDHIDDGCRLDDDFACFKCLVKKFKEQELG